MRIRQNHYIKYFSMLSCHYFFLRSLLVNQSIHPSATIQGTQAACGSDEQSFPGNNLYLALWLGLYSSAKICLEWKAAKAMHRMSDAMHKISGDDSEVGKGPEANDDVD